MANMLNSGELIASISADLADNNAGLISAEDVRSNMEDTAVSINKIVASGDTDVVFPFFNDVRAKHNSAAGTDGRFIAESGILFPNAPANPSSLQREPFLGVAGLSHNSLADLATGDVHTQYYALAGTRALTSHFKAGSSNWINASGLNAVGFRFNPKDANALEQEILTSGTFKFDDNSRIASGKGTAKAWLNFNGSGTGTDNLPVVRSYHNISGISRLSPGKYKITFTSGTFADNDYIAIGQSNATSTSGSPEDFAVNSVGLVMRSGTDDDYHGLRSVTFLVKNNAGQYVDAEMNDFVAYGYEPTETSGTIPTAIKDPNYTPG